MAVFGNTCKSSRWVWAPYALTLQAVWGKVGWGRKQHLASVADQAWSGLEMKFAFLKATESFGQSRGMKEMFCIYSVTAFRQQLKAFPSWWIFWSHAQQQNQNKTFLNQIYTSLHKIFFGMFIDKYWGVSYAGKTMPSLTRDFSWPVIDNDWWCGQNNFFAQIFYGVLHRERVALLCVHQWTIVLTDNFSPQSFPWELLWPTSHKYSF